MLNMPAGAYDVTVSLLRMDFGPQHTKDKGVVHCHDSHKQGSTRLRY